MVRAGFRTVAGQPVTAVTAAEMGEVDRVAVEDVGLQLLQTMENAGRILAWHVRALRTGDVPVVVVAGNGGNGGGGMTCARHLATRGIPVRVIVDRPPGELSGAAATQSRILDAMDVPVTADTEHLSHAPDQQVTVDALIGYGLTGEVRAPAHTRIGQMNSAAGPVVSLDVPSGIDATTGDTLGAAVTPDRTVTLALPKIGLETVPGPIYLADITIPDVVYERLGIEYTRPFGDDDWIKLDQ